MTRPMDELEVKKDAIKQQSVSSSGEQSELMVGTHVGSASKNTESAAVKAASKEKRDFRSRKSTKWLKKNVGRYFSISFLVMLLLSFVMWYVIKLGYNYVTDISLDINIDGHRVKVKCVAEGQGYTLLTNKFHANRRINLSWSDLEVTPSAVNPGYLVISPYSLQNAISVWKPDIKIISIATIPEVGI